MRIPQELIDKILDDFDLSEAYDPRIELILKSCALVARSFVWACQTRLFARISIRDYTDHSPQRNNHTPLLLIRELSALLSSSPHIATYIRTLELPISSPDDRPWMPPDPEAPFAPRILSAVTEMRALALNGCRFEFPANPSTLAVFSISSLRRVELRGYQFQNPFVLESLLYIAKSLKELTLGAIGFPYGHYKDDPPVRKDLNHTCKEDQVILETLTLLHVTSEASRAILNRFTKVNLKHLTSLSILESPCMDILRVNAHSMQKLTFGKQDTSCWTVDVPDPDLMAGENCLTSVDFAVEKIECVLSQLPYLGDLRNLKNLKIIRITINYHLIMNSSVQEYWIASSYHHVVFGSSANWPRSGSATQALSGVWMSDASSVSSGVKLDLCRPGHRARRISGYPDRGHTSGPGRFAGVDGSHSGHGLCGIGDPGHSSGRHLANVLSGVRARRAAGDLSGPSFSDGARMLTFGAHGPSDFRPDYRDPALSPS
ncbi:hypothetical protein DFH06DRAFT_575587 [Mycena polygramma]|nr:hypothetical protein DFH06DRAFT_575587 [Mycena polygramma]